MALAHISLNSSRRNNTCVKATDHADYINREGKYKNIDEREAIMSQQFLGDTIAGVDHNTNSFPEKTLYKNILGSIKLTPDNKISVSDGASSDTISLALSLAIKKYGNTLDLQGSNKFKAEIVVAARNLEYDVNFTDKVIDESLKKLKDEYNDKCKRFAKPNSEIRNAGSTNLPVADLKRPDTSWQGSNNSKGKISVQELSMGNVDDTIKELGMLLSSYQSDCLDSEEERFNLSLRRNLYRKKVIDSAADEILQNGKAKTSGASHSDYINRLDVFAVKGGCIYKDNFLPKWAKGSAKNFFKAADQYERKNGVPYFEYQLSLQNELTLEQNLEIVNTFIRKSELLKDKYYAFAIHDKQATLDKSQRQIHCHLMFSTRCIDNLERKHERDAKTFFARANSKDPAKGGCKKDRRFNWDNPKERTAVLMRTRKLWEDIVNATFRKYGMDEQISTKTLEAQREEALKQKDYLKAEILNRAPEKTLGPNVCSNPSDPLVINVKQARATNKKRIALLEAAHEMKQLMNDERLIIKFSSALNESEKLKNDYTNNEELKGTNFDKLIKSIEELSTQLIEKRKNVISYNGAVGLARLQQMTSNEYYAFRDYRYSQLQDKKLKKELSYLEQKAIKPERQSQIKILLAKYKDIRLAQKDAIEKLNAKLSTPKYKSRITKRANVILKENAPLRQEADTLANKLADMSATLRENIAKQLEAIKKANETIPAYTAVQINHIINTIRFDLEKQIKAKQQDLHVLYPKIISEDRAKVMGVDIVTNGESKRLRDLMNSINKDKQRLEGAKENINILKYDMAGLDHKSEDYLDYKAAYDKNVANKKTLTEQIATNTTIANNLKAKLIDTFKQPAIRTKTQNIINGILQKNLPLKTQYDTMLKSVNSMKQQVNQLAKLQKGINAQVRLDKNKNITYCVKPSSINTASAGLTSSPKPYKQSDTNNARILAEAFSGKIDLGVQIFRIEDDKYDEYADYYSRSKADAQAREAGRGIDL